MSEGLQWQNKLSAAIESAKNQNKLVLIDFYGQL
jgi:hypothetical protein